MKTVDKALTILGQFTLEEPELGLSELARRARADKAATRRILVAMAGHGLIEQAEESRKYRLGPGFLRFARIREAAAPFSSLADEALERAVAEGGETIHATAPVEGGMVTVAHRIPRRVHVVTLALADILPFHATASGLAFWAFAGAETSARIAAMTRARLTDDTLVDETALRERLRRFREQGFSETRNSYETGVASFAMPIRAGAGDPVGCVSMALPDAELSPARRDELLPVLRGAVDRIETGLSGG